MSKSVCWWLDTSSTACEVDRAEASELGITIVYNRPESGFYLARADHGLALFRASEKKRDASYYHDLIVTTQRRGDSRKNNPLARACGLHRRRGLSVFDATAGLGCDSAVLAFFGCSITAVERHAVPAALTRDALTRAHTAGLFRDTWPQLYFGDARQTLEQQACEPPDVVYLDPMFAAPRRRAKPRKIIAWFGELIGPDEDAGQLLEAARQIAAQRVVVKRHARQQPLASPNFETGQRAIRFDVYLNQP